MLGPATVFSASAQADIDTGDHEMQLAGIAGTSAGAIVAALTWAGYKPDHIQSILAHTFAPPRRDAFFGPYPDRQFASFDALVRTLRSFRTGLAATPPRWLRPRALHLPWRSVAQTLALLRIATWLARNIRWLGRRKGLLRAEGFEARIESLLRHAPFLHPHLPEHAAPLTFADVAAARPNLFPLFLMVTDADRRSLRIVSSIDPACASLSIARAIRASAGFPGFFQPVELGDSPTCIDGGVISNVPTWVFDQAFRAQLRQHVENPVLVRLAALPWVHVALRLETPAPDLGTPTSGRAYLRSLWSLLAGIGRRRLEDKMMALVAAKQFTVHPLPDPAPPGTAPAGVLDFEALADPVILAASFGRGRAAAQRAIDPACFQLPDPQPVIDILQDLVLKAEAALAPYRRPGTRVRARVFFYAAPDRLQRVFEINVDPLDVDAHAVSPTQANIAALTYFSGRVLLANLRAARLYPAAPPGADPFDPASLDPATWLLTLPILDELDVTRHIVPPEDAGGLILDRLGPIYGVLNVDADLTDGPDGMPLDPIDQVVLAPVRLAFDAARVAAERLGTLLNAFWLGPA